MLKFDGNGSNLEVCSFTLGNRCFLNRQIIVLLTALGTSDRLILDHYNEHVSLLINARKDSISALNFLESVTPGCYVPHQECLIYAFKNGLFELNDPFLLDGLQSLLNLSLLNIKRKSQILVRNGALLKGVADFTGILEPNQVIAQISDVLVTRNRVCILVISESFRRSLLLKN